MPESTTRRVAWCATATGIVGPLVANLVMHRVGKVEARGDGTWTISMKGDDNEFPDELRHAVGGDVRKPALRHGGWGTAVPRAGTPAVAVPLVAGLVGLRDSAMFIPAPARARGRRRAADAVIA